MENNHEQQVRVGFFSFVGPNYSRSSTLFNFKNKKIEKIYIHVPGKFPKSLTWVFRNRRNFGKIDVFVVMSPCHMLAPVLRAFTKKPLILDAGWSLTDGVLARGFKFQNLYKLPITFGIDLISMHAADLVLVESKLQRSRIQKYFALSPKRIMVSYTGLDETQFENAADLEEIESPLISEIKEKIFQGGESLVILFRGRVNRESGFKYICEAARLLKNEAIFIFILGEKDMLPRDLNNVIQLSNVSSIEMKKIYEIAHLAIGQISSHPRLNYTIPHKAFEAGYFATPYISADNAGIREFLNSEDAVFITQPFTKGLVDSIHKLSKLSAREVYASKINEKYKKQASQFIINQDFENVLKTLIGSRKCIAD